MHVEVADHFEPSLSGKEEDNWHRRDCLKLLRHAVCGPWLGGFHLVAMTHARRFIASFSGMAINPSWHLKPNRCQHRLIDYWCCRERRSVVVGSNKATIAGMRCQVKYHAEASLLWILACLESAHGLGIAQAAGERMEGRGSAKILSRAEEEQGNAHM